jgi:predicted ATPase
MFKKVLAKDFGAVPYLETSQLMKNHKKGVEFSLEKPNVIIGPMGAGKSAMMKTLALHTLSFTVGMSAFDDKYVEKLSHIDDLWKEGDSYKDYDEEAGSRWKYLHGLAGEFDVAPAVFYRPGALPGDNSDLSYAFCDGYSEEVRSYDKLTKDKSSGQRNQALLQQFLSALEGKLPSKAYQFVNWSYGTARASRDQMRARGHAMPWELQAEVLKARYLEAAEKGIPCVLADEPEQSLDAKGQAQLWHKIAAADPSKVQVIVATHSLYPILHPEQFNIIEAVPGYAAEVRAML